MRAARPFCRERVLQCLAFVLAVGGPAAAFAQPARLSPHARRDAASLNVFLDCSACDLEYQRQHVTFVSYVRDRGTADLYVLVTTQDTGGGGMAWVVRFIGMGRFQRQDRTFTFATAQRATADDRRKEFARIFRIGLAGYALDTPIAPQLDVDWRRPAQGRSSAGTDPWNYWTFRIGANGNVGGEQSSTVRSYRVAASSSRTTQNSKITVLANSSTDKQAFKIDGRAVESRQDAWTVSALVVKSLGGRAGAGFRTSVARSSFTNTDRAVRVAPAVEVDFFPYSESNRRSLTVQYNFGTNYYEYREVTIFDKLRETVPTHGLNASLGLRAAWGTIGAHSGVSQHVRRRDRYRASISGSADVSLFKGLSFDMYGQYDKVNDQISLRKGSASPEQILLGLRQLPTDYGYSFSVGVSYSFGSIFSSVVNPRFGG
jgi:hypothetical protein